MQSGDPQQPGAVAGEPPTGDPTQGQPPMSCGPMPSSTGSPPGTMRRPWVVGVLAGLAIVVVVAVVMMVVALIPTYSTEHLIGPTGGPFPLKHRLLDDFMVAWGGDRTMTTADTAYTMPGTSLSLTRSKVTWTGLVLIPSLVAVLAIVGAGLLSGRFVPGDLRSRLVVWAAAVLTAAVAVTIAAAAFTHEVALWSDVAARFAYPPLSSFVRTLVLVTVFGAFSFGVVARLPKRVGEALWGAAAIVLVPMVVVALVWPVFVAVSPVGEGQQRSRLDKVLATSSSDAAGVAAMSVPLALGARGELRPDVFYVDDILEVHESPERWHDLAHAVGEHPKARLWTWADAFGPLGVVVAVVAIVAYVVAWVVLVVVYTRRQGVRGAAQGAICGLLVGGAAAVLSVLFSWMGTWAVLPPAPAPGKFVRAGVGAASSLQAALILLASAVLVGVLAAVIRPRAAPADAGD